VGTFALATLGCPSEREGDPSGRGAGTATADTALRLYTYPDGGTGSATGGAATDGGPGFTIGADGSRCEPACTRGESCVQTSCVREATLDETRTDPISGHIVQLVPDGARTRLVLDVGAKAGVKTGAKGTIAKVRGEFTVDEVFPFRSTAIIELDDKAIGDRRDVTITR